LRPREVHVGISDVAFGVLNLGQNEFKLLGDDPQYLVDAIDTLLGKEPPERNIVKYKRDKKEMMHEFSLWPLFLFAFLPGEI
jgi:hypothetical protein